jgi:ribosomal protein S18 acetylase RimI-like enzyme
MYKQVANCLYLKGFTKDDYQSLVGLESHSEECFWETQDFRNVLGKQPNGGCYLLVQDLGNKKIEPVAFVVYENSGSEFHILNLVVHSQYRRRGYGSVLINRMKEKLRGKFKSLKCDVRDTNLVAHLFLKQNGFLAKEVIRGHFQDYYPDQPVRRQDGYFFEFIGQESTGNTVDCGDVPIHVNRIG